MHIISPKARPSCHRSSAALMGHTGPVTTVGPGKRPGLREPGLQMGLVQALSKSPLMHAVAAVMDPSTCNLQPPPPPQTNMSQQCPSSAPGDNINGPHAQREAYQDILSCVNYTPKDTQKDTTCETQGLHVSAAVPHAACCVHNSLLAVRSIYVQQHNLWLETKHTQHMTTNHKPHGHLEIQIVSWTQPHPRHHRASLFPYYLSTHSTCDQRPTTNHTTAGAQQTDSDFAIHL